MNQVVNAAEHFCGDREEASRNGEIYDHWKVTWEAHSHLWSKIMLIVAVHLPHKTWRSSINFSFVRAGKKRANIVRDVSNISSQLFIFADIFTNWHWTSWISFSLWRAIPWIHATKVNPEIQICSHRPVGVEGFHKLIYCHDRATARATICAGFLSCCATGLFLDIWPPLCIFTVGQQMFSWVSPVFWAIYSASSLGDEGQHPHK